MKVLIGCEFSQVVTKAFRDRGHEAYSCDILPTKGDPNWHIQDNVLDHLNDGWDMAIIHPPCTFICRNSAYINKNNPHRQELAIMAKQFFMSFLECDIEKICVENPVPALASKLPKYTQTIQPYQFGHDHSKRTCLWLKNLPKLKPTNEVELTYITTSNGFRYTKGWYQTSRTSQARSITFTGIAEAMADQWGENNIPILEN